MKYDAPATAASVARGITRSDVRKILTGLPRENILLRGSEGASARERAAARGIYRPYYYASARPRVGHLFENLFEKYFALIRKLARSLPRTARSHRYESRAGRILPAGLFNPVVLLVFRARVGIIVKLMAVMVISRVTVDEKHAAHCYLRSACVV